MDRSIPVLIFLLTFALTNTDASEMPLKKSTSAEEKAAIINALQLEPHVEGGYFKRTFQADHREKTQTPFGSRFTMTSIYYLLTSEQPIGHFHKNRSDIAHFFHSGSAIEYFLISPLGELHSVRLGSDFNNGEVFQFVVPGGWWKASRLTADGSADYGLISEAVAPGFEYQDMALANTEQLSKRFPQHKAIIKKLSKKQQ